MKLLLDTHAFLRLAIASPQNEIFVSAVTVWEIAIKRSSGKLTFGRRLAKAIADHGFNSLPITIAEAEWAGELPQYHRDPFDRLLVAQAQLGGMILVTVDEQILRYQVPHL